MAHQYPDLRDRPVKETICLFDVDGTLSPARRHASPEMLDILARLRQKIAIGYVGGSDFSKQEEQLGSPTVPVTDVFDFCFAENGLTAYRLGEKLPSTSFISWIGEEKYQKLVKFILKYIAGIEGLPAMRGTFIEFRNGMINVSPVGRNASQTERSEFEAWDNKTQTRAKLIEAIKKEFPNLGLTYSIGGQISFDVFPTGWDKTYCLHHIEAEADPTKGLSGVHYKNIHFFGDKAFRGGNDWEIYQDSRTIGHAVKDPDDTIKQLKELFDV
ncbi:phosphomannomutase [Exophiala aquamarina CBS 119918]|uniref:Phosphomannomutase n=1 Tax=Exophiala aquamarina CBS 119918 TaxID=1182545 RepID=A0A072NXM0_9EURO|nr:phosphomannomutase [Exophiala aquamarina CBS 119918]KEF52634.1 phosphomannomutase [Exophiala aquamarina CBS 119918]